MSAVKILKVSASGAWGLELRAWASGKVVAKVCKHCVIRGFSLKKEKQTAKEPCAARPFRGRCSTIYIYIMHYEFLDIL